jgi:SAM-dependent methyltransferase
MFDVSDAAYDRFMGRFSFPLAKVFAAFAGVAKGQRVLDVGAGTGALTAELVQRGAEVCAAEPSESFARVLRSRHPEVELAQAPAEALPWPDEAFDAAMAQLVLAFMSDAAAGIAQMRRVVRPGGTLAVCMWDLTDMGLLSAIMRTQKALGGGGPNAESRTGFRSREAIEALFAGGGFQDVRSEALRVEAPYASFEELWDSLINGAGPAGAWAKGLAGEQRETARAELHRQVGSPAGAFSLSAVAWATRAQRA